MVASVAFRLLSLYGLYALFLAAMEFIENSGATGHWLARAITQQNQTLQSVATFILKYQFVFFDDGVGGIRLLQLRMVAGESEEGVSARSIRRKIKGIILAENALKSTAQRKRVHNLNRGGLRNSDH